MNLCPSSNPTSNKIQNFNNFFPLFPSRMMGCFSAFYYVELDNLMACLDGGEGGEIEGSRVELAKNKLILC